MCADPSASSAEDSRFPRAVRLLSESSYSAVFGSKNIRVSDGLWTVLAVRNSLNPPRARLGLAISKKRARRAVDRNRLKRLARESFRQHRQCLKGYDIVVMNRDRSVNATNPELSASLTRHWHKLTEKGAGSLRNNTAGKPSQSGSR